ncbi:hypothetical protein COW91_02255 [Candidatus Nomurabacteria bacterium CG22_combo_CG10-13_8_21_14_all_32_8]|uniref:Uncharacterized protein n=2 Tax=Candidatus Nomuraibacteriota TaxID=1752729 RepID=A0A2H0CG82_9BACT|nr:MAG: hypothetical protein COW91_02255 [Candidatus Nomurabacteria bacterium CG22_combo_CG10-13_8_21_14_all_32_8]PIZ86044.1 MAG: hypothetical protein COX94_01195 [Candidatus Nomurabacteria bacterium CG_4_10_14_0_2_um_filter_33_9]
MVEIEDYNKIMSDRKLFDKFVYTSLPKAIKILEERQKDPELIKKIEKLLNNNIPEPFRKIDKYGISGKQIATPNSDTRWFIKLNNQFGLKAVFLEFHSDKFTSNNDFKHSLGQLIIHKNFNKKGEYKEKKITIIDFNKYDGKPLKNVLTLWSESLIDFHRRLFEAYNFDKKDFIFYDESKWLSENGSVAKDYYKNDLMLYICHGILFENFLLNGSDGEFTKNILLPAIQEVINLVGIKPLIVPIPPMDMEEDLHWFSYDEKIRPFIRL